MCTFFKSQLPLLSLLCVLGLLVCFCDAFVKGAGLCLPFSRVWVLQGAFPGWSLAGSSVLFYVLRSMVRFRFGFCFDFWRGGLAALVRGVVLFRLESPVEQLLASVPASPSLGYSTSFFSRSTSSLEDVWKGQLCLVQLSAYLGVLPGWERPHTSGFFLSNLSVSSQW